MYIPCNLPRLFEYNLVFGSHKSMILSTQQLMAGGKSDATDSQSVYHSDVFEQYQWFTAGLFSLASNLLPPVPGMIITGLKLYAPYMYSKRKESWKYFFIFLECFENLPRYICKWYYQIRFFVM